MRDFHGRSARAAGLIGISLAALVASEPAFAEEAVEAAGGGGAEIVVTASRRDTNIQDTPIAVSVTTGEALTQNNVASLQDLTRIEPSVVVNNQGVASNQFIIRGILSDIGSTTGLYLDEVPLVGGGAVEGVGDGRPGVRLHDISRIEVLKGPQGTLFGSGSMAGTLRIITNKPERGTVSGGATVSGGWIDQGDSIWQGDAFINLPVADTIALRGVMWGEKGGAYIDHHITTLDGTSTTIKEDVNSRDVWGGRLQLLFQPTPDFSILLAGVHQEVDVDDGESWNQDAGPFISTSPTVEGYHDNYDMVSATIEYSAPFGTFTAIGSYANQKVINPEDSTPTGLGLSGAFGLVPFKTTYQTSQDFDAYTGELRFTSKLEGPLQFVVGAYYEKDKTKGMSVAVRADDATGIAPCFSVAECEALGLREAGFSASGVVRSDLEYAVGTERTVEQWALYGQVDLELTQGLTATAGIRYFDASVHDVETTIQDIVPDWAAIGLITTPYETMNEKASENSPSYNFSLLYEATPDLSFFGRVASGFRIGGVNNAASFAGQTGLDIPDAYASDELWSYELGVKAYLANRRLYVDASVYQMDWSNQPLAATDPTGAFEYVINAGDSRIRGAELSVTYNSDMGLSFGGGVTFTDAKLTEDLSQDVMDAGTIGYKGDRIPRVPRWTAAGQLRYETDLSANLGFYVQGDISYRGSSTYSFNDENAYNETLDSSVLVGAQLGVKTAGFDFSIFARNLTNETAVFGLDASPDGLRVYSADPRTIGAKISTRF